jgi:hypothetical protein
LTNLLSELVETVLAIEVASHGQRVLIRVHQPTWCIVQFDVPHRLLHLQVSLFKVILFRNHFHRSVQLHEQLIDLVVFLLLLVPYFW